MRNKGNLLLADYYENWIHIYKEGAIRDVTMEKYRNSLRWIRRLAPELKMKDISRASYQQLINDYAIYHER